MIKPRPKAEVLYRLWANVRSWADPPRAAGFPELVFPTDPRYDGFRKTYNPRFDSRFPAFIARCASEEEVKTVLHSIASLGLPFRVRSGGHSLAGYSSIHGGAIIDLSLIDDLHIDQGARELSVGAGCKMSRIRAALLGTPFTLPLAGDPVCVGGYLQGGGYDATCSRSIGMNCDSMLNARVLLADGQIVTASSNEHPDLWWALRGGTGGNFGIVLAVKYRLHTLPQGHSFSLSWPLTSKSGTATAIRVLLALQNDVMADDAPLFNPIVTLRRWPDFDGGEPATLRLTIEGHYHGPSAALERRISPLRSIGRQESFKPFRAGTGFKILRQSRFTSALTTSSWQQLLEDMAGSTARSTVLNVAPWGGKIADPDDGPGSFIHRNAVQLHYMTGYWRHSDEEFAMRKLMANWQETLASSWNGHCFQNFADADAPDYRWNYWGDAHARLASIKAKFDPNQVFAFSQQI